MKIATVYRHCVTRIILCGHKLKPRGREKRVLYSVLPYILETLIGEYRCQAEHIIIVGITVMVTASSHVTKVPPLQIMPKLLGASFGCQTCQVTLILRVRPAFWTTNPHSPTQNLY